MSKVSSCMVINERVAHAFSKVLRRDDSPQSSFGNDLRHDIDFAVPKSKVCLENGTLKSTRPDGVCTVSLTPSGDSYQVLASSGCYPESSSNGARQYSLGHVTQSEGNIAFGVFRIAANRAEKK